MISKFKLALIVAVASMGIASPAFAQAGGLPFTYDSEGGHHGFTYGYSQTGAPDHNQTVAPVSGHALIAARQSGLQAFASVSGGYNVDGSYNHSGYDGSIATQR